MRLGFWKFVKAQWTTVPPVDLVDLSGTTVIVADADIGLCFEAAKHLASMNPEKLILACRNKEKGEAAVNTIKEETRCMAVEFWSLDLASFASVKSFAENFEREGGRLDILVGNADNASSLDLLQFTDDGWEASVQVNDLSTSLLALLLLPRMLETVEKYNTVPRLVVVASEAYYWTKVEKNISDASNLIREYAHRDSLTSASRDGNRYHITNLWNIFFVRALNDRLHRKPIIVNAANPGYYHSALRPKFKGVRFLSDKLIEFAFARRTIEESSRVLVWAAVGPRIPVFTTVSANDKLDKLRGAYISLMKVREPSDFVISEEGKKAQEKFWTTLVEELSQVDPKVSQIVKESLTLQLTN